MANFALSQTRELLTNKSGAMVNVARLAPEVLRGESNNPKAGDVYSFGVLLWELLTRQQPWAEEAVPAAIVRRVGYEGARLPLDGIDASSPLASIVSRCFLDTAERPSFDDIVRDLGGDVPRAVAQDVPEEFICPITVRCAHTHAHACICCCFGILSGAVDVNVVRLLDVIPASTKSCKTPSFVLTATATSAQRSKRGYKHMTRLRTQTCHSQPRI